MMPNVGQFDSTKGGSFRETVGYVLQPHSERTKQAIADGHVDPAEINHRAAAFWNATSTDPARAQNGGPVHPDTAAEIAAAMQDVADRANDLKRAAGISTRGRKATTPPQYHASFRDAENAPAMTDEEWVKFIMGAMKALDLPDGHQMLIVKHVEPDRPHWPDWHVVVNKVSSRDGTRWNPMNDQQKLQAYCDDHDKQRGLNYTPFRRDKIEATRKWAAKEAQPKQRDRSKPLAAKTERPPRRNYRADRMLRQLEREGLPVTPIVADMIDKQLLADRDIMRNFGSKKRIAVLAKQAADEKRAAWEKYEQAKLDAAKPSLKSKAAHVVANTRKNWHRYLYERRAAAKQEALKQRIRNQYRVFYQRERLTIGGGSMNALALRAEAQRRGLPVPRFLALANDPAGRKALLADIARHDRNQLKKELRADWRATSSKHRLADPETAARAAALSEYRESKARIEGWLERETAAAKAVWADAEATRKASWKGILTVARREGEKMKLRAEQEMRDRATIIGPTAATAEEIMEATRKAAVRMQMRDAIKDSGQKRDTGRERRPGRGR